MYSFLIHNREQVVNRKTILSNVFTVFIPKQYPGPVEATFLSRTFSDQGVKMRIRKEHRLQSYVYHLLFIYKINILLIIDNHRRKRKLTDEPSVDDNPTIKKYYTKASKSIVAPPSYAEPSSSASSDVFFGRWQATAPPTKHHEPAHRISTPPHQPCDEHKGLPNKLKYQYAEDHAQAFPSPESTIYNTMSSSSSIQRSMSWGASQRSRSQSHRTSQSSSHLASPALIDFTESPPLIPTSIRKSHDFDRLPTPSNSMEDLHAIATGAQSWGTRLPPLRAIMSNIQLYNKHDPSLFPLLLPPPVTVNQPSMMMHEYHYR